MVNISISLDEKIFAAMSRAAEKRKMSMSAFIEEVLGGATGLAREEAPEESDAEWRAELDKLFAMVDKKHAGFKGGIGKFNREECYERGLR